MAPEKFIETISVDCVDIVAFSVLLTTTMPNMKSAIKTIQQAGLSDKAKTITGGALVAQECATQIGIDGFSSDASRVVSWAQTLMRAEWF